MRQPDVPLTALPDLRRLSNEDAEHIELISDLLSDEVRLQLLYVLSLGVTEIAFSDLQKAFPDEKQSNISMKLTLLRYAGLVKSRREAKKTFYSLATGARAKLSTVADFIALLARTSTDGSAEKGDA